MHAIRSQGLRQVERMDTKFLPPRTYARADLWSSGYGLTLLMQVISCIMVGVWFFLNFRNKDTSPALEHAESPTAGGMALVGFVIAYCGIAAFSTLFIAGERRAGVTDVLCFVDAPRIWQLIITIRSKSTEGIEPFMFTSFLLQNFTLLIVSASRKPHKGDR
jgi:hypothetical protein